MRLNKYYGYFVIRIKETFHFRLDLIASFVASIIELIVALLIWRAIYRTNTSIAGYDYMQMLTYLYTAQAITAIYGYSNAIEGYVFDRIRTGDIVFDLLKPVDFNIAKVFEGIGSSIIQVVFVGVAFAIIRMIGPNIIGNKDIYILFLFIISVILGFFIMSFFSLLIGLLSFYLTNNWGIYYIKRTMLLLFSGSIAPLTFFPDVLRTVCKFLPFSRIVYTPTVIYMAGLSNEEILLEILYQIIWLFALILISEIVYKFAIRKVTINGG